MTSPKAVPFDDGFMIHILDKLVSFPHQKWAGKSLDFELARPRLSSLIEDYSITYGPSTIKRGKVLVANTLPKVDQKKIELNS